LTKEDVKLAVEKSRESRLDMVNQVTKAFYQLLLAQDSYEVLQKSYAQSEENYRVVSAKYQQGTVSEYDKISAEVQMRSIKPSVVSARNGVNLAKLQLKVLMGMTAENEIEAQGNLKDHETELFARQLNDTSLSLAENSTLKQLDLNEAMLQRNLKIQKSNFLPTLALSFQYLYTTLTNDFKFSDYKWNPYSTVALSFSMPLFKGSNFSKVKQAKIQLEELKENRRNTELQLQMQATTYLDNMTASTEQVVSNREAVAQAEKGRLIAEKRYEVGKGTILELNNSEVALTQAELTYNQSIFDYLSAQADLDKVLGKQYPVTTKE
jgi:outer membrane protein TolC